MRADLGRSTWIMLNHFSRRRRVRTGATLALVGLGPVLAVATFLVLGPLDLGVSTFGLRFVLLLDFVYVLSLAGLVLYRIARMVAARGPMKVIPASSQASTKAGFSESRP